MEPDPQILFHGFTMQKENSSLQFSWHVLIYCQDFSFYVGPESCLLTEKLQQQRDIM